MSPSFEDQLGYDPSQAFSLSGGDLVHPDDMKRVADAFEAARRGAGEPLSLELRVRAADRTWRWFDVTITNLLDDPDVAGVVSNLHDITDRKASEVALRDAEERFRTSFDEAPIGMILVSRQGLGSSRPTGPSARSSGAARTKSQGCRCRSSPIPTTARSAGRGGPAS